MNFRSLAIFTAVCEEKSMTAAARRLHLAQPSVSLAIRELETEYDCVFFERLSKRLYLTEAGQRFYAYAQRILALQEEMDVCFHERTYERQLRIGSSITIASTVLFPLLHDFCQQHPAVQLHTKVLSTYTVESAVLDNQLDLALIEGTPRNDALTVIPLCEDQMALVCAPDHPLAKQGETDLAALQDLPVLTREENSATRSITESLFTLHHLKLLPAVESVSNHALIEALRNGMGVSILPRRLLIPYLNAHELCEITLKDQPLNREWYLIHHSRKALTAPMQEFIRFLQQTTW